MSTNYLTGHQLKTFRLITLLAALRLEMKGMRRSRGPSARAMLAAELGLVGRPSAATVERAAVVAVAQARAADPVHAAIEREERDYLSERVQSRAYARTDGRLLALPASGAAPVARFPVDAPRLDNARVSRWES